MFIVPNFHPASCGWLTTFSKERVYCANSYLNHLDRVREDPNYRFVMSEANNFIAIMNFQPDRIAELKAQIHAGKIEVVNAYFLESTINLSGGEALLRLGVEGKRWFEHMFDVRPRFSWNIDVCGTHEQMPQIASELGLEALVYTRKNPTGKTIFRSISPDGSSILTFCPGHYSEAGDLFSSRTPLGAAELSKANAFFDSKEPITPANAPLLILAGSGDYALAPLVKSYPTQLLKDSQAASLGRELRFATLSEYVDAVRGPIASGQLQLPVSKGGTAYDFDAFWIENPRVKADFRRNEHMLQASEAMAAIASLKSTHPYPAEDLYHSWLLLCLNMDRNTLWGSAGGMVFEDASSWDVQDRFTSLRTLTRKIMNDAVRTTLGEGKDVGLFNALNWRRNDPFRVELPAGRSLAGTTCEELPDGSVLCQTELPPTSVGGWKLARRPAIAPKQIEAPNEIDTGYYLARIDPQTGALVSLKLKSKPRELLSGPANVIVAERPHQVKGDPGDFMPVRPERAKLGTSSDTASRIVVTSGPLTTTFQIEGTFYGGASIRRVVRFHRNHPRIDFETELNDIPNLTVVIAEFPLADDITEVRRGIPFGFSHGGWSTQNENLHGWTKGIVPAVRWSDYSLAAGGGLALFDRGCSGRELNGRTPIIYLLNAEEKYYGYPNSWLSGKGRHRLQYALAVREQAWDQSSVPQQAWEYNTPPYAVMDVAARQPEALLETSENLILESMRREGDHLELRLVECTGAAGTGRLTIHLPHQSASLTSATGERKSALTGNPNYQFPVKPQQIVTVRLVTVSTVPIPAPITSWAALVPKEKQAALNAYDPNTIGHPPKGS